MKALFKTYCYECHSNKKVKGKLNLKTFSFDKDDPKLEDILGISQGQGDASGE